MSNTILSAVDIGFTYKRSGGLLSTFHHDALRDISFDLNRGETVGILGRNGGGKSTLLRILAGIIDPTKGKVVCEKSTSRALLSLGLGFMQSISGRENAIYSVMLQGGSRKKAREIIKDIEEFAELGEFFDQPVETYSTGMRARLGFATAVMTEVDILFIDEVLSVGDVYFLQKAESVMVDKLKGDQTCVFVSHSPAQVNKICSKVIWIEDGIIKREGDPEEITQEYVEYMRVH